MPTTTPDIQRLEFQPGDGMLLPSPGRQILQVPKGTLQLFDRDRRAVDSTEYGRLKIQFHDAYRYQRELSISRVRNQYNHAVEPAGPRWSWEVHTYRHPGLRSQVTVSDEVARRLTARIWELATQHRILLFNAESEGKTGPVGEGFVHFHELLLWGATPSVSLLP